MGYDLHITRAEDWIDSPARPILEADWLAVVASDPTLSVSDATWLEEQQPDGSTRRIHPVEWNSHPFWFRDGEIVVKNPDDGLVAKMVELAQRFNARVVGDDHEEYS